MHAIGLKAGPAVGLLHASPASALKPVSRHAIGDTAWRTPAIVGYRMSDVGQKHALAAAVRGIVKPLSPELQARAAFTIANAAVRGACPSGR